MHTFYKSLSGKLVYFTLSMQVFCMCYSGTLAKSGHAERLRKVQHFIDCVQTSAPEMLKKMKVHPLLYLPENILDFGPAANYNTER